MIRKFFPFAGLAIVLAIGCEPAATLSTADQSAEKPAGSSSAMKVSVITPARKSLVRKIEQPGEIQAFEQTPIHAKVAGYIGKVHVDLGDQVKAGQLLAEISIPEYEQEWKQKQALVAQAAAETAQATAAITVAQAALDSAKALLSEAEAGVQRREAEFTRASAELARITALFKDKAVTQKSLDEATASQQAADAARSESQARITSAKAVVAEKEAAVLQAKADATAASAKEAVSIADEKRFLAVQEYTKITAPYDGVVTERNVSTGHLVQLARSAAEKPLFVMVRADTVRVFIDVPESDAGLIATGAEATIRIPARGNSVTGKVTRSAWTLNPATRTLRAEVDLPNADGTLRPGMYVVAELVVAKRDNVFALPKGAILMKDQQASCLIVNDEKKIAKLPITLGIKAGDEVEVLSGLSGSEAVIPGNVAAYRGGQSVEIAAAK